MLTEVLSETLLQCCLARVPYESVEALRLVSRACARACDSKGYEYVRREQGFQESVVLVVGGSDYGYRREAWLLAGDRWCARAPLPFGRDAHCLTDSRPHGRELFATGGRTEGYSATAAVVAYDPRRGAWRRATPLPTPRFGHAAGVVRPRPKWSAVARFPGPRKAKAAAGAAPPRRISVAQAPLLVVAGGYADHSELASCDCMNLDTGRWSSMPPLPLPVCYAAAAVLDDGKFYVAGGAGAGESALQCWSPDTGEWALRANLPQGRQSAAAVVLGGNLFLIGGLLDLGETASVIQYCPRTDSWAWDLDLITVPWLPRPRAGASAAVRGDGSIVLVGGGTPLICTKDADGYRAWREMADLPIGWVKWPALAALDL